MRLTEEQKTLAKEYYEKTNSVLELKLGLFHITNEFSFDKVDDIIKELESNPDRINEFIDKGVNFSTAQRRFKSIQLTQATRNKKPDRKMNEYLIEAFWCFVIGMFKAAAVLCRTAIERGIRDQLDEEAIIKYEGTSCGELIQEEKDQKHNIWKEKKLGGKKGLIETYIKKLEQKGISAKKMDELKVIANCIRIKGNIIVHSQEDMEISDREEETLDILLMTRGFLAEIYNV
jgi:hypothetical protein